jgi:hypothetical protein
MHEMDNFKTLLIVFISVQYLQFLGTNISELFNNSSMFYVCFFDVKLPEDDLKKTKHVGVLVS